MAQAIEEEQAPQHHRHRRERIREMIAADGAVKIDDLANTFMVSAMTIHRDLDLLQSQGWLRKVRGGAISQPSNVSNNGIRDRIVAMSTAKGSLAAYALNLIEPGSSVIIDHSTTSLRLASLLPSRAPLVVITNFLPVVKLLAGRTGIDLVALGGAYDATYDAFIGLRTVEAVRPLSADLLFMSSTAVTNNVCYNASTETVQVKRALLDAAATKILLVDGTKFERRALNAMAPLTAFDLVVVDESLPAHRIDALRTAGVTVEIAPTITSSQAAGVDELVDLIANPSNS